MSFGTRIALGDVLGYVVAGMTSDDFVTDFPEPTVDHVRAAHEFAALSAVGSRPLR